MSFLLLLVLNAVLYIRPGDLVPSLEPLHLYEIVILSSLAVGLPKILPQLTGESLAENPITTCVIALFAITVLADLLQFRFGNAYDAAETLVKILIYYLLLVGLTNTPARLRWLLVALLACGVVSIGLAMLHYHGVVNLPNMTVMVEEFYVDDERQEFRRMGTTSIFSDPNDCALFIDHCLFICLYLALDGGGLLVLRLLWLLPMAYFGYALSLTQSRGGLSALAAGLAAYFVGRNGRKALLIGIPLAPVLMAAFAGRQSNISLGGGTGQARVQLWAEYFSMFTSRPIFGVGWKTGEILSTKAAHNSYLQGFAEQGFFAGSLFVGAYYLALRSFGPVFVHRPRAGVDIALARMRPCLLAIVVSQAVGMMGLTRNIDLPTYTVLGLAAVYARLAGVDPPLPKGERLARQLLVVGIAFLVYMYVLVRVYVRF